MNTPDTEGWEKTFDSMFNWADQIKEQELDRWMLMYGFVPDDLKTFIRLLLTSRDTYWKERVRKEVEFLKCSERTKRQYGDWVAETYEDKMLVNAVLDTLLDNLK
jgi:hypothetical protein